MASKKKSSEPPWQILLEEMRSQNRATIEAVDASRTALEQRIDRLEHETRTRDATLEMAIRELRLTVQQNSADIQKNGAEIQRNGAEIQKNGADIRQLQGDVRELSARFEVLARVEERVTALEKRFA